MRQWPWSRIWAANDGLGAIEFGFIAPVLIAMLLGVLDFGIAFWHKMEISTAADAGAQWGMSNSYHENNIRLVAQSATNLTPITITPTNPCGCPSATGITIGYGTPPSCTTPCPDATAAQPYIVVNAQKCYSPLFHWPGLSYGGDSCTSSQISLKAQAFVLK
jgi:Flp pilus assembly protein TadG